MEQPVSRAMVINLEHFPAYEVPVSKRGLATHIARYLKGLLADSRQAKQVELPSFSVLSKFFRCTHLEIYDAFKALRSQGYDYQFSGLDGSVIVWLTLAKNGGMK